MSDTITTTSSVFVAQVLADAVTTGFTGAKCLLGTGAVRVMPGLTATQTGLEVSIPVYGNIGEFQAVSSDGTGIDFHGITSSEVKATVKHAGNGFTMTQWAAMAAAGDAYQIGTAQIVEGAQRMWDTECITVAKATDAGMTLDGYSATKPRTLDWDLVCDARALWGDEDTDVAALCINSKVKADLRKLKDSSGRPLFVNGVNGQIDTFQGIPVFVSDRLTPSSDTPKKYTSLLLKKNAIGLFYNGTPEILTDVDIKIPSQNVAIHTYYAAHRFSPMPGQTKSGVVILVHN